MVANLPNYMGPGVMQASFFFFPLTVPCQQPLPDFSRWLNLSPFALIGQEYALESEILIMLLVVQKKRKKLLCLF
jgi:hypothetical protein